ncbi:hypothetical protein HK105_207637 [Polyrhizophydium stewartii]|uniref:OsmC family protein n=1 Tax=Polyrhizophydium stewartii TaxID=2732419 RepID=A0ABR4N091_9FUNG
MHAQGPAPHAAAKAVLVAALGGCTEATLAAILRKQRQPVTAIDMALTPTLADTTPREIVAIHMAIGIAGDGLEMEKIEKAVALAEHHCPVHKTLSAAVRITRSITLRQA